MAFLEALVSGSDVLQYAIYFAVLIFFLNQKTNFDKMWIVVLAMVWFGLFEVSKGQFWDIFSNTAWTFAFGLMAALLVFVILGLEFSIRKEVLLLMILAYFLFLETNMFFVNLIGVVGYIIFVIGFLVGTVRIIKNWLEITPEPESS
jgi:hypothetical protein